MKDLIYVANESGFLMPLFYVSLAVIGLSIVAAMVSDAYYKFIPAMTIVSGIVGVVSLLTSFIALVSINDDALNKNSESISNWLKDDKDISISKEKVKELLDNDSFEDFLYSDESQTRVSEPFVSKGMTYVLVFENKEFYLSMLNKD
jgi:hypothetical protein